LVRHASDVGDEALEGLSDDDGHIAVQSGVITIGDAHFDDVFAVRPGRWRIQVALTPRSDAERVDVWLSPAS
jgi:hypothetical protein